MFFTKSERERDRKEMKLVSESSIIELKIIKFNKK